MNSAVRIQSYFQVLVEIDINSLLVEISHLIRGEGKCQCIIIIHCSLFTSAAINQVVIAAGSHLFPFRTEKLSPLAPMVLQCNAGE